MTNIFELKSYIPEQIIIIVITNIFFVTCTYPFFCFSMCQRNQPLSEDDLDSLRNCIFYEHRHYCKISEVWF